MGLSGGWQLRQLTHGPPGLITAGELRRCLVSSVFTPAATTSRASLDVIVPQARRMPLYRLINDPFQARQERADIQREATMADYLRPQAVAT